MPIPLLIASNNPHKVSEFRRLLDSAHFTLLTPADLDLTLDVAETGDTFAENATLKARAFCAVGNVISLADDSGLVVDALGGEPGIRSARYGEPGLDDAGRTQLVLQRMHGVPPVERGAHFVAAIAIAFPNGQLEIVEGRVDGVIAPEPRGVHGFGYDPIFIPSPGNRTFAEISAEEKGERSHRGIATRQAVELLTGVRPDDILGQQRSR